jgi:hypothetical protein
MPWWLIVTGWTDAPKKYYIATYDSNSWLQKVKKDYAINHLLGVFLQLLSTSMTPSINVKDWVFRCDTVSG